MLTKQNGSHNRLKNLSILKKIKSSEKLKKLFKLLIFSNQFFLQKFCLTTSNLKKLAVNVFF